MNNRQWTMDIGQRTMNKGQCTMTMDIGQWTMNNAIEQWTMDNGQ